MKFFNFVGPLSSIFPQYSVQEFTPVLTIRIIPVAKWSRSRRLNNYALILKCRPKLLSSFYAVITSYGALCHLMCAHDDC